MAQCAVQLNISCTSTIKTHRLLYVRLKYIDEKETYDYTNPASLRTIKNHLKVHKQQLNCIKKVQSDIKMKVKKVKE